MLTNIKLHLSYLLVPGESLAARYNWCQDPVPGRGPAVEKYYSIPLCLTSNNCTSCPHSVFTCFFVSQRKTAIVSLHKIDWLIVLTQTKGVYCAVRTELFNTIQVCHSIDAPYGFSYLIRETNGRSLGNFKRQAMYVNHNIERRWCEQCCSGKTIIITYSEYVFVVLVIQHALRMRLIFHMWLAWLSKGAHIVLKNDFRKRKSYWT